MITEKQSIKASRVMFEVIIGLAISGVVWYKTGHLIDGILFFAVQDRVLYCFERAGSARDLP